MKNTIVVVIVNEEKVVTGSEPFVRKRCFTSTELTGTIEQITHKGRKLYIVYSHTTERVDLLFSNEC